VAALVDTNVLVYRFDPRFPEKQRIATDLLRRGIGEDSIRVPHQAIVEFVAAVTRPPKEEAPLVTLEEARREAEELLAQFEIVYPNEALVRTAYGARQPTSSPGSTPTCGPPPSTTDSRPCSPRTLSTTASTARSAW
jgi:predicted nucleic acid-binding protein